MDYVQLGRSGAKVSRLCLGTMNFGPRTVEADAFAIMDAALTQHGFNFFDTANTYGGEGHKGRTEEIIGRWFAQGGRRDSVFLATKFHSPTGSGPNDRGGSAYNMRQACEASLRRLKTDHIDLYQVHHIDRSVPWDEFWQAMDVLIRQGKVIYAGSSNFAGWHIATACEQARRRQMVGLVCEQTKYNLNVRTPELEVIPACRHHGVGLICYSPLENGLLAGRDDTADTGRRVGPRYEKLRDRMAEKLAAYAALCRELGAPEAVVSLAWLLHNPVVTAPIIGPRTMHQLEAGVAALALKLDGTTLKRIDEIWPGPGKEAPEAYAW